MCGGERHEQGLPTLCRKAPRPGHRRHPAGLRLHLRRRQHPAGRPHHQRPARSPERVHRGRYQGDHRRPGVGPADPGSAVDVAVPLHNRRSRSVDAVQPARDNPDRRGSPIDAGPRVSGFRRRAAAGDGDRLRYPVRSQTIWPGLAAGLPFAVPVGAQLRDRPGADPHLRLPARPLPRDLARQLLGDPLRGDRARHPRFRTDRRGAYCEPR